MQMKATLRGHVLSSQKIYINKKKKNPKQTNQEKRKNAGEDVGGKTPYTL
jgi:hypothetical protein